jgi:radical SAM superfamily enzyme YgiQ (UPF0313 family)
MPDSGWGFDEVCKVPNLGISSLAGNIDEEIKVGMADLVLVKKKFRKYVRYFIKTFKPDLVGLSCMTFQYQTAIKIAKMVKDIDYSIKIVLGGYHPTLTYREIIKSENSKYIDFIIRGEGEATINELVKSIQGKFDIRKIKGLTYRKKNKRFINNGDRNLLKPEQIKLPNRKDRFLNNHKMFMKKVDSIETSRGCIYKCKFCSIVHMYGNSFRDFTTERVCDDISNAKSQGTKILMITDDNFTLYPDRVIELCNEIIEAGHDDIYYYTQAGVKGIASSPEMVRKMSRAGFDGVFLGIENVSERNLKFYNKGKIKTETEKAVKSLHEHDMIIAGGFVLGSPDDKEIDFWDNYNFSKKLKLDWPVFQILTPYPKTKVTEELHEKGLITNYIDLRRYNGTLANIRTKYLSDNKIRRIQQMMYNRYYYDTNYMRVTKRHHPLFYWILGLRYLPRFAKHKIYHSIGYWSDEDIAEDMIGLDEKAIID